MFCAVNECAGTRHIRRMSLIELYGHEELKTRLAQSAKAGTLPASLLFHGPKGVGKQRLALWLAQLLLCENDPRPCGKCRNCEYAVNLTHPDLHWYFPRPRLKDADPDLADVRDDYRDAIADRVSNGGLYASPPGNEGIFVATVRAIVQEASLSPAMAKRKVFIIGDAERMVSQEGSDQAANAFLKLLEEPPADTTVILTSSEPGALLPTVRSRVIAVRALPLTDAEMKAFVEDKRIAPLLDLPTNPAELVKSASGAPGRLAERDAWTAAIDQATRFLDAASAPDRGRRARVALSQGVSGARGKFSDTLDALT